MLNSRDERANEAFRIPYKATVTKSVPLSDSAEGVITIPDGYRVYIQTVTIAKGADCTITSMKFDDQDTAELATFTVPTVFGKMLAAEKTLKLAGDNASVGEAQDIVLTVAGYQVII